MEKFDDASSKNWGRMTHPSIDFELEYGHPGKIVVGVDEVGRGCLAGPVVAAAVVLPPVVDFQAEPWLKKITDSKALRPQVREELVPEIQRWAKGSAIGMASVEEIDQINILNASHLAMVRAIKALPFSVDHVLVDGNHRLKEIQRPNTPIIKGDTKSLSIACASILAKVWRDHLMEELDVQYPGYGLSIHKGYPTSAHINALDKQGVSHIHRRTFSPVKNRIQNSPDLRI
ncbi:MAG: ribonuclease HII [Bdellovibrionaceae bacterium]|nr:ribonuclease HII [Pseudobdellovibrionaceae bacterium]|tara:strand:+ start:1734 stop:2426 length:693 start_codon:yes stop_codon:yes gene_type:complete